MSIHFHNISLIGGPGVLALGRARAKLFSLHEHWLICPTHVLWKNGNRAWRSSDVLYVLLRSGIPPQLWRLGSLIERQLEHVDLLLAPSSFTATKHREEASALRSRCLPCSRDWIRGRAARGRRRSGRGPCSPGASRRPRASPCWRRCFAELPQYDLWVAGDGDLRERCRRDTATRRTSGFWARSTRPG